MFDLQRIETETFIQGTEFHRELASTNDLALELSAADELRTPLLVLAERQTAGRGRGTNRWWSGDGALTLSLVLDSTATGPAPERRPLVSLATGLAIRDAIDSILPDAGLKLKWPNDVYLNGRKACGILTEVPHRAPARMVVGIGLNVNNSFDAAPPEIRAAATSLRDAAGREHDPTEVLVRLLRRLEAELAMLAVGEFDLPARWRPHCVLHGRTIQHTAGPQTITGVCAGLDARGALILQTETGPRHLFGGTVKAW